MKRVMAVALDTDLFNVDNRCVSFLVQHSKVALTFQLNSMKNNKKGKIGICPTTQYIRYEIWKEKTFEGAKENICRRHLVIFKICINFKWQSAFIPHIIF